MLIAAFIKVYLFFIIWYGFNASFNNKIRNKIEMLIYQINIQNNQESYWQYV